MCWWTQERDKLLTGSSIIFTTAVFDFQSLVLLTHSSQKVQQQTSSLTLDVLLQVAAAFVNSYLGQKGHSIADNSKGCPEEYLYAPSCPVDYIGLFWVECGC